MMLRLKCNIVVFSFYLLQGTYHALDIRGLEEIFPLYMPRSHYRFHLGLNIKKKNKIKFVFDLITFAHVITKK